MHTVEIPDRHIVKEFPSCIQEMNSEQYLFFVSLLLEYLSGKINTDLFRIKLIKKLLDIRITVGYFMLPPQEQERLNAQVYQLSLLCDSFFTDDVQDGKPVKKLDLWFIKNLIPKAGKFYGPADALTNITFYEYRTANGYFRAYLKTKSEDDLNHLIATLYRPRKWFLFIRRKLPWFDGQERVKLTSSSNPLRLEKRCKKISGLPYAVRYGIFLWYSGCEDFLINGKPEIDGNQIDLSQLYKSSPDDEKKQPGIGMAGILYTLAESHVFGSIHETDNQNLFDVMARLYQVVMQNRDMEEKIDKAYGTH